MYFWRVDRLKSDLVAGRVGEPETFRYILACLAVLALSYLAGVLDPPEIRDRWTLVADVAASLTVVPGTMLAYAANGGARGRHFPARYFSLAWVLTIRCIALTLPAVVVVYGVAVAVTGTEQPERALTWLNAALACSIVTLYYWRLCHHVREVAAGSPGPLPHPAGELRRTPGQ